VSSEIHALEARVKASVARSNGVQLKERVKWLGSYPVGLRLKSQLAIQDSDWKKLARHARDYRRDASRDMVKIRSQLRDWTGTESDMTRLVDAARARGAWKRPDAREDWDELRARVVQRLVQKGATKAEALRVANQVANTTFDDLVKVARDPLRVWASHLETAASSRMSALAAVDLAEAVARFNRPVSNFRTLKVLTPAQIRKAVSLVSAAEKGLHRAVRTLSGRKVAASARALRRIAEKQVPSLVDVAIYHAPKGSAADTVTAGRLSVTIASALRLALRAVAAARYVEWIAEWPEDSPLFQEIRKAARARSFPSRYSEPPLRRIEDLAGAPADFDGRDLCIEGRIGPVTVIHEGSKVLSVASVTDATGSVIAAGVPHYKIDSVGLVAGSYARLSGTFRISSAEFSGPTLIVDRRDLTTDSETSWSDWLSLRLLPILTVIPHGLCVETGWTRGRDGPGNPVRYGVWSANKRRVL
jgi:hypothetical protein